MNGCGVRPQCCFLRPGVVGLHWADKEEDATQHARSQAALDYLTSSTDACGRKLRTTYRIYCACLLCIPRPHLLISLTQRLAMNGRLSTNCAEAAVVRACSNRCREGSCSSKHAQNSVGLGRLGSRSRRAERRRTPTSHLHQLLSRWVQPCRRWRLVATIWRRPGA